MIILINVFNYLFFYVRKKGCNLYCLDKNYGGVLIIWDKIFGTFIEEKPTEELIFGLVVSPQTYNPLYLQVSNKIYIKKKTCLKNYTIFIFEIQYILVNCNCKMIM